MDAITQKHLDYYNYLRNSFSIPTNNAEIPCSIVANVLKGSGLSSNILAIVWEKSNQSNLLFYNQEMFLYACVLVAMAQQSVQNPQQLKYPAFFQFSNSMTRSRSGSFTQVISTALPPIKENERAGYLKYFMQLNPENGKFVPGTKAKSFFTASGLSLQKLQKLWDLCDVDKDGKLDESEFIVMTHIALLLKNGIIADLPEEIPKSFFPPSKVLDSFFADPSSSNRMSKSKSLNSLYNAIPAVRKPSLEEERKQAELETEMLNDDYKRTSEKLEFIKERLKQKETSQLQINKIKDKIANIKQSQNEFDKGMESLMSILAECENKLKLT